MNWPMRRIENPNQCRQLTSAAVAAGPMTLPEALMPLVGVANPVISARICGDGARAWVALVLTSVDVNDNRHAWSQ